MTQTAYQGLTELTDNTWTLISEVNCTFSVVFGDVMIIGTASSAPASTAIGFPYYSGDAEGAETDVLGRFPGVGTANRLYAKATTPKATLFVSRAAVA